MVYSHTCIAWRFSIPVIENNSLEMCSSGCSGLRFLHLVVRFPGFGRQSTRRDKSFYTVHFGRGRMVFRFPNQFRRCLCNDTSDLCSTRVRSPIAVVSLKWPCTPATASGFVIRVLTTVPHFQRYRVYTVSFVKRVI